MPQSEARKNERIKTEPKFSHRRTHTEIRRVKRGERTDIRSGEWGKYGYAQSDILQRQIVYDEQTRPVLRVKACDINYEQFFRNYAAQSLPVIIEGACAHWPAMQRWDINNLKERFKHVPMKCGEDSKGKKLRMKLKYFADYMKHQTDDNPIYMFETGVDENTSMNSLTDDFEVPEYFPDDYLNLLNHDSRPPHRWFCIGPKRSGTTVHTDPLGTSAWNAVTHGVKRWVLFEPSVPKRIAKAKGLRNKGEDDEAVMYFDFLLPRLKQAYPDVVVYEGLQHPGDIIFVPGNWWHGVLNLSDCVAVTQNYCGPHNFAEVWCSTRKSREKIAHLWLRNMRKFAPKLHEKALELNRQDGFSMRHERKSGEKVADKNSSSSESSDSTSDDVADVFSNPGIARIVDASLGLSAAEPKKRRLSETSPAACDRSAKTQCQCGTKVLCSASTHGTEGGA